MKFVTSVHTSVPSAPVTVTRSPARRGATGHRRVRNVCPGLPSLRPITSVSMCSACSAATEPPTTDASTRLRRGARVYVGSPGSGSRSTARIQYAVRPATARAPWDDGMSSTISPARLRPPVVSR